MNGDTTAEGNAAAEPIPPTPGQMLREQRELRSLTVQQVSERLHLTMHYIKALESDSYDKLPGEVFAKGYIRSYARLLEIDPDTVLSLYEKVGERRQARKQEARKRHARRRLDRNRPWVIVSGIAFVALAVLLWYINTDVTESMQPPAVQAPQQNQLSVGSTASADEVSNRVLSDEVPDDTSPVLLNDGSDAGSADPGNRVLELDWGGLDTLHVTVYGESWVEVDDRLGSGQFRDLMSDGDQLRISGTAPFSVLLGNARQIELQFNGRVVDVTASVRGDDTARLTLGM